MPLCAGHAGQSAYRRVGEFMLLWTRRSHDRQEIASRRHVGVLGSLIRNNRNPGCPGWRKVLRWNHFKRDGLPPCYHHRNYHSRHGSGRKRLKILQRNFLFGPGVAPELYAWKSYRRDQQDCPFSFRSLLRFINNRCSGLPCPNTLQQRVASSVWPQPGIGTWRAFQNP